MPLVKAARIFIREEAEGIAAIGRALGQPCSRTHGPARASRHR